MQMRGLGRARDWGIVSMVRILLADDHAVVRRGLRALLEARQDFEICAEASNGRDAVELALHHRPDVAVLDLSLPIVNGIEATRQIRKEAPGTEVMIFTLHDKQNEIRDVLHAGARGYVLKSEADEQIVRAIEALARHNAYFSNHVSEALLDNLIEGQSAEGGTPSLTAREREVVRRIAEGNSNKKIAQLLQISVKTVETHRAAAMRKLDIHSTAELTRYAVRQKLVAP
jgi:DNA-binding NarL/FixJ family response regulator